MKTKNLMAIAAAFVSTTGLALAQDAAGKSIRALLLTGGGYHDYERQKDILTKGLSERVNIEWTIVDKDADATKELLKENGWADAADVVVYNICFADETDAEYIESVAAVHEAGKPAVVIHCTLHSYHWKAKTDAWVKFLGVTSMRHGRQDPIAVKTVAEDHPIMKSLPAEWKTPQGELYHIEKVAETATVLADGSIDDWKSKHAVVWANEYGKARVFGTSIGHHNETMADKNYLDLVSRGLLWATGHIDDKGEVENGFLKKD